MNSIFYFLSFFVIVIMVIKMKKYILACLASTLLLSSLVGCNDEKDEHYTALSKMKQQLKEFTTLDETPFNLVELPFPKAVYDEDGERLPATYANFLIMKSTVLMPSYNQPENDNLAISQLQKAFPGYKIVAIDCRALIKQHGSLHCVTMQLPQEILAL